MTLVLTPLRATFVVPGTPTGPITEQPIAVPQTLPLTQELGSAEVGIPFGVQFGPWLDPSEELMSVMAVDILDASALYGQEVSMPALVSAFAIVLPGLVVCVLGDGASALPQHRYCLRVRVLTTASATRILETTTSPIVCPF